LSSALCAVAALCYWRQPDTAAAITVFPVWIWLAPGLMLAAIGFRRRWPWPSLVVAAAWLAYVGLLADEPRSLLRGGPWPSPEWSAARARGMGIRVISLNCAAGDPRAAAEVAQFHPDIVLLQESPSETDMRGLASRLFGRNATVLAGWDASILSRWPAEPEGMPHTRLPAKKHAHFVEARVRLPGGREIAVISLRLNPPQVRLDLWSADCRRSQTRDRRVRRDEMREVRSEIDVIPERIPLITGGDCNAPQGDAIFRLLGPRLRDSFAIAGRGWGNTVLNDFPFARIDQVWVSEQFRVASVVARRTQFSDHRMVICDLIVNVPSR
jgi:endonuclease/exonuclease/phosphatase (EEP) superfamily protein YafD